MSIVVVGASSAIAQTALEQVSETISPSEFTLISRNPAKLSHWRERGASIIKGDATDANLLAQAFEGNSQVLLISGLNVGERIIEHQNVINAAKNAAISHITYTSVAGTHSSSPVPSAKEHFQTEILLWQSGLSFCALRNQMYFAFFFNMLSHAAKTGRWKILGRNGRMAPVASSDIASCVSSILLAPERHARVVYEITGPDLLTLPEIAQIGEAVFNTKIEYVERTPEQLYADFDRGGFSRQPDSSKPVPLCFGSDELVNQWIGNETGYADIKSGHIELITGKKPIDLKSYLQARWHAERTDRA